MELDSPDAFGESDRLDLSGRIAGKQHGVLGQDNGDVIVEVDATVAGVDRQQRVLLPVRGEVHLSRSEAEMV